MARYTITDAKKALQTKLDQRERKYPRMPAQLGDGNGTVEISGRPSFVYIRLAADGALGYAFNNRVPPIDNLPVIVGYDALQPDLFQVLSTREVYAGTGETLPPFVVPHHESHEFGNTDGGYDVVWVQQQQIVPLQAKPTDPASMTVTVNGGVYGHGGGWSYFATETTSDLSGYIPDGTVGNASRFVGISIDPSGNSLQYTQGGLFSTTTSPSDAWQYIPDLPARAVPVAAIVLDDDTTSLGWNQIYDLRALNSSVQDDYPLAEAVGALSFEFDFIAQQFRREISAQAYMWLEHDMQITMHITGQA